MRILITGGAGFVGSSLALKLKEKYPSYHIICVDNLKRRGSELNLPELKNQDIEFIHSDVRISDEMQELPAFDLLLDASAEPSVLAGIQSSVHQVVQNNLVGTINCLELAKKNGAGFIFLSTSRIYPIQALEAADFIENDVRFDWSNDQKYPGLSSRGVSENFPLEGSRSFYGATKLASELFIQEYHELSGLSTVINRCGVIAGPRQMGKVDQGVLVLWLARHFWKGKLSYIGYGGEGKQVRDLLHIDDLFDLIDFQIHNIDQVSGTTMNVGGGKDNSVSLQQLTSLCEDVTGNSIQIDSVPNNRPADLRIYITNNSKVNQLTGWKPKRSPRDIVSDVYEWVKQEELALRSILNL